MGPRKGNPAEEHPSPAFASMLAAFPRGLRVPAAAFAMAITAYGGILLLLYGLKAIIEDPQSHWPLLACGLLAPAGVEPVTKVRHVSSCHVHVPRDEIFKQMHHFCLCSGGQDCVLLAGSEADCGLG